MIKPEFEKVIALLSSVVQNPHDTHELLTQRRQQQQRKHQKELTGLHAIIDECRSERVISARANFLAQEELAVLTQQKLQYESDQKTIDSRLLICDQRTSELLSKCGDNIENVELPVPCIFYKNLFSAKVC